MIPTIGFNVETIQRKNIKMSIWDVGGAQKIRNLWGRYLDGIEGLIYAVDGSDEDRLGESGEELKKILGMIGEVPVLVLANKSDGMRFKEDEMMGRMGLGSLSRRNLKVFKTNWKDGKRLEYAMDWMVRMLKKEVAKKDFMFGEVEI